MKLARPATVVAALLLLALAIGELIISLILSLYLGGGQVEEAGACYGGNGGWAILLIAVPLVAIAGAVRSLLRIGRQESPGRSLGLSGLLIVAWVLLALLTGDVTDSSTC